MPGLRGTLGGLILTIFAAVAAFGGASALESATSSEVDDELSPAVAVVHSRFLTIGPDRLPARWDPCEPVHYWVNPAGGGDLDLVHDAARRVARASGIDLVFAGETTERPRRVTEGARPRRGIVIGWSSTGMTALLDGDELATTSVGWRRDGERLEIVAASVAINLETTEKLRRVFGGTGLGGVLLHEFGHALGLAHSADRRDVMAPGLPHPEFWGPGDRRALEVAGECRR